MADPTAIALAELFDIDLSAVGTDEQATQAVVSVVSQLINDNHELVTTYAPDFYDEEEPEPDTSVITPPPNQNPQAPNVNGDGTGTIKPKGANVNQGAIAASHISPQILNMAKRDRQNRLQNLVNEGKLTVPAAQKLLNKYGSDQALSLSLNSESSDGFDEILEAFESNEPVVRIGEQTGSQHGLETLNTSGTPLALSHEELKDEKKNPLLAATNKLIAKK